MTDGAVCELTMCHERGWSWAATDFEDAGEGAGKCIRGMGANETESDAESGREGAGGEMFVPRCVCRCAAAAAAVPCSCLSVVCVTAR